MGLCDMSCGDGFVFFDFLRYFVFVFGMLFGFRIIRLVGEWLCLLFEGFFILLFIFYYSGVLMLIYIFFVELVF